MWLLAPGKNWPLSENPFFGTWPKGRRFAELRPTISRFVHFKFFSDGCPSGKEFRRQFSTDFLRISASLFLVISVAIWPTNSPKSSRASIVSLPQTIATSSLASSNPADASPHFLVFL